jgi:hypothetical protein
MNKTVHFLRYGTVAEKTHLERTINAYDYLVINGNSAAYVSRAIGKFVVEQFLNKQDKGFIIDPITYAFQQNIDLLKTKSRNGQLTIKKSITKLIEKYGYPINKVNEDTPVKPSDFSDPTILGEFCHSVLDFQYSIIDDYISNNELKKYLKYAILSISLMDTSTDVAGGAHAGVRADASMDHFRLRPEKGGPQSLAAARRGRVDVPAHRPCAAPPPHRQEYAQGLSGQGHSGHHGHRGQLAVGGAGA